MNIINKLLAMTAIVTVLGVTVLPRLSSAENYVVSPSFIGNSSMTTAQANQVCMGLPDSVASQTSFCMYSGINQNTNVSIADHDILISATSPTSVRITWTTIVPTTSVVTYGNDWMNQNSSVQYSNTAEGYTTYHTVYMTGLNLVPRHIFKVGGSVQGNSSQTSSAWQWI